MHVASQPIHTYVYTYTYMYVYMLQGKHAASLRIHTIATYIAQAEHVANLPISAPRNPCHSRSWE